MKKFKYALSHGKILIIILIVAVIFVSSGIHDVISQLNSARDGIEVLLVDTTVSYGSTATLEKDIKNATGIKHVGAATLTKKDALEYVATIENYTLANYIEYLTIAKDCEAVFVTKSLLKDIYTLENIIPMGIDGVFGEECYKDGVLYAVPLKNKQNTQTNSNVIALQEETYAILLNGDHSSEMRAFLQTLIKEDQNA